MPGVSVIIKGTSSGTITDIDGNYRLNAPENAATIVFSYVGFRTAEVEIGSQTVINLSMDVDEQVLNEVVVTAVGIEKNKRSVGYAIENVDGEVLQQRSEPDLVRSLQGKTPGVEIIGNNGAPGSSSSITIRGYSSTGANQPLIVVDGVPFNNDGLLDPVSASANALTGNASYSNRLGDINPNDIENISVLRGASASVLYGSRAANGVILITTKSGKGGKGRKGMSISYSGSYTVEQVQKLPDFQNEYGQGGDFVYDGGFYSTWGPKFSDLDSVPHHYSGAAFADIFPELQGKKVPYQAYPDNVADFYRTGSIIDNSISLTGGNENGSFFASYSRTDHTGFIPGTSFDRNNFGAGGQYELDNGLKFGANLNYMSSQQQSVQAGGGAAGASPVHSQLWYIPRSIDLQGYPYQDPVTGDNVWYRTELDNPIWNAEKNKYRSQVDRVWGNIFAEYNFTDWIKAAYKFGYNNYNEGRRDFIEYSSNIRPSTYNKQGGLLYDEIVNKEFNSNFLLTINRNISNDLNLNVMVGQETNQRQSDRRRTLGTTLITRGIDEMGNTTNQIYDGGGRSKRRLVSLFADVALAYKDMLFFNYQARNDWSSTLPKENRSFFYQGVNASWVFTESFDINNNILSYGKIRVGYGKVGKDASPYNLTSVYVANQAVGNNTSSLQGPYNGISGLVNGAGEGDPNLTPEFTTEIELGTELQFLQGRIGLDFTVYDRNTTDIILLITRPASSGFVQQVTNAGEIDNKGVEIGLNLVPVQTTHFKWDLYTTFTKNNSNVVRLAEGQTQFALGSAFTGDFGSYMIPGKPFGVIQGSAYERTETGEMMINSTTGIPIETQESQVIADPNRDFNMAVINTLSYKGLSFNFMIDFLKGGQYYSATAANMMSRGVLGFTAVDRETPRVIPGVIADPTTRQPLKDENGNNIPNDIQITTGDYYWRGFGSAGPQEGSVYGATVIKLREISLMYNLPSSWLSKTPFGSASLGFSGRNLWFHAPDMPKGSAIDPDNGGGQLLDGVRGFDFAYMPNAKRFSFNLRFTL
ncbi:SusC/RagA family TonB-linked outer membrane protein [Flexithrix dorotheae]|uniref:SusC/RagA family TonB-linked outer membrane protein n=1 Tax=Flexithrix dorotheae TaxID=70993 RepID=UPI00035EFD50|nr:SusC/RagA family TonB-linked outer membrane protein [Flexithrix dorotheae]